MTTNNRGYPDISFVDTDAAAIENALIQSYERFTGRTLYPADPARLFVLWVADIIIQERVNIDFSAKQNLPRYAEGEYLDSLAEIFKDAYRLEAKRAKTTLKFTLSVTLETATIIPAGTRATADGEIMFQTLEALTILAGGKSGTVTAECLTAGEIGNGFVPGQINQLVDIFPYWESVQNVSESDGGADEESDAAFYDRMRESMETFSTAGPEGAYIYHAKTASSLIADVSADSPVDEPGVVDVRILLQNGKLPTEEVLKLVLDALSAEKVRPLTDLVRVSAPDTVPFNIDVTYYIPNPGAASAANIERAVNEAVERYRVWQTEKMGRDINPSYLTRLLMETGVKRVEVREPLFQKVEAKGVAVLQDKTVLNGGVEDE